SNINMDRDYVYALSRYNDIKAQIDQVDDEDKQQVRDQYKDDIAQIISVLRTHPEYAKEVLAREKEERTRVDELAKSDDRAKDTRTPNEIYLEERRKKTTSRELNKPLELYCGLTVGEILA